MTTATIQEKPVSRPILAYFAVALALAAPLLQLALRPLWEMFPFPLDRFMSLTIFWIISVLVLVYSVRIEGIPLYTFGIGEDPKEKRSLRYRLLEAIAALIAGFVLLIILILLSTALRDIFQKPIASTINLENIPPFWVMFPAWLTAAFCEELLFRSYPIERLNLLTGKRWLAALISGLCFVLFHGYAWDWLHLLSIVLPAAIFVTGMYLWRRSLWFVVIIHAVMDITILFLPFIAPYL